MSAQRTGGGTCKWKIVRVETVAFEITKRDALAEAEQFTAHDARTRKPGINRTSYEVRKNES